MPQHQNSKSLHKLIKEALNAVMKLEVCQRCHYSVSLSSVSSVTLLCLADLGFPYFPRGAPCCMYPCTVPHACRAPRETAYGCIWWWRMGWYWWGGIFARYWHCLSDTVWNCLSDTVWHWLFGIDCLALTGMHWLACTDWHALTGTPRHALTGTPRHANPREAIRRQAIRRQANQCSAALMFFNLVQRCANVFFNLVQRCANLKSNHCSAALI